MNIENAEHTLKLLKKCAVDAGIYHAWFLNFGTLLGAIRPSRIRWGDEFRYVRGIIESDDDMDVGILSDRITKEQEDCYVELVRDNNLFESREMYARRSDTGRLVWFSLRGKKAPLGTKCCNWFWLPYHGYYWHTKGYDWVSPEKGKFRPNRVGHKPSDEAVMLGMPNFYLSELIEITFYGERFHIPARFGSCLDWWYPEWIVEKKGVTSARQIHCVVPEWGKKSAWRIC